MGRPKLSILVIDASLLASHVRTGRSCGNYLVVKVVGSHYM